MTLGNNLFQFFATVGIELFYIGEDNEWILGVTAQVFDCVHIGVATQRCSVCLDAVLIA